MSKYQDFLHLLKSYCAKKNCSTNIETTLRDASLNDTDPTNPKYITLNQNLNAISMDSIAQNVVRKIHFAGSTKNSDSPASVDAFLIDASGKWYFIEYKNQKLAKTKEKCIEKSYSNVFWLMKILEELKNEGRFLFKDFSSCPSEISPFDFVKEHCHFVLVAWDNGEDVQYLAKMREAKKANLPLPDSFTFLKKLESYVFKSAQAYTANEFNQSFVQNFQY